MMYKARDLLTYTAEQMWALPDGPMQIEFDDGLLETTARRTIFSWYHWVYHRMYPSVPLLIEHHMGDVNLTADTHLSLLGRGLKDCRMTMGDAVDIEDLTRIAYQTTNLIFNDFTYNLEEYVSTISALDFIEVVTHPVIKEANENTKPKESSIKHCYNIIEGVLKTPGELMGNAIAKAAKGRRGSMGQTLQCVSHRGYLTDIDSHIFRHPILRGYVHGFRSLYDSMIETRSASKALMFAKEPLALTEYFNRKMQLGGSVVNNVHHGDCGSTRYMSWRVKANDIRALVGKYHLVDSKLVAIKPEERHLIGKQIHMRTVFGCRHPDPYGVCATCLGEIAFNIPRDTNLGHVSTTVMCQDGSQQVLSTKHLDGSAAVDEIELSEFEQRYLSIDTDPNRLCLSPRLKTASVKLVVQAEEVKNLSDIAVVTDDGIRDLPIGRMSDLTEVMIQVHTNAGVDEVVIPVYRGNRHSAMTHDLLIWIKQHGFAVTERGHYEIDLTGWDVDVPIFELPMKHVSMVDYMNTIETMIKSAKGKKGTKTLRDFETPDAALVELHELVSSKLQVPISYLEVIILSTMIKDSDTNDRFFPKDGDPYEFGVYTDNMALRSLTGVAAYQGQTAVLTDPKSFVYRKRARHILDPLLMG